MCSPPKPEKLTFFPVNWLVVPGLTTFQKAYVLKVYMCFQTTREGCGLSGSHRSTDIASDLASRALTSQAKPQRESESQAVRIAQS